MVKLLSKEMDTKKKFPPRKSHTYPIPNLMAKVTEADMVCLFFVISLFLCFLFISGHATAILSDVKQSFGCQFTFLVFPSRLQ